MQRRCGYVFFFCSLTVALLVQPQMEDVAEAEAALAKRETEVEAARRAAAEEAAAAKAAAEQLAAERSPAQETDSGAQRISTILPP